jgi:transcriptional regulator of NAD metabolism
MEVEMDRRKKIIEMLSELDHPIKGSELADRLDISRQTLVQDIALLRKDGYPIISTTTGYILDKGVTKDAEEVIGINHTPDQLSRELEILISHHVRVLDVIIDHPVYGRVRGELNICTPKDVKRFLEKRSKSPLPLFSEVTGGFHYHTLQADEPEYIEDAVEALQEAGFEVIRT